MAVALTDWVITDARGAPTRVPDGVRATASVAACRRSRRAGCCCRPRRPTRRGAEIDVRAADIDPMAHVNNAAYIDYLEESLTATRPTGCCRGLPRRYRLEYVAAAGPA